MSHIPQRKEKDCLNCGTVVQGPYCHNCGQENVVPHETFWHMVKHFLYDITHFDSKFFDSMKYLLFRPGFLPQEYMKGRRASYLNPVKKYVFTSAVFFLLFFSFFSQTDNFEINLGRNLSKEERTALMTKGEAELKKNPNNEKWQEALALLKDTTRVLTEADMLKFWDDFEYINLGGRRYRDLKEYDSVQKTLPKKEKDGWFKKMVQKRNLKLKEKYKGNPESGTSKLVNTFLHKLPYLLFISLPLFALALKLLYLRRKNFYYADHGIFSIYHYIFSFLLLLLLFAVDKLQGFTKLDELDFLIGILFLSGGVYLYLSMKRFYGQGHLKTFMKFLLLNIAGLVVLILLFLVFLLLSVFEI